MSTFHWESFRLTTNKSDSLANWLEIPWAKCSDKPFVQPPSQLLKTACFGSPSLFILGRLFMKKLTFWRNNDSFDSVGVSSLCYLENFQISTGLCKGTRNNNQPIPMLFEIREALWCLRGLFQSVPQFNYPEPRAVSLSKAEMKNWIFLNANNKDWYLQKCLKNW